MNDGMLSQDEIDALLNVSEDDNKQADSNNAEAALNDIEIDTIGEIGNISFGSSATTLSMLLNQKVEITTPTVSLIEKEDLNKEFTFEPVSVQVDYTDGFSGRNIFVIKAEDAAVIADIMLGGDGSNPDETLTEISISAVQEAMNQMMGAAATSMSTIFNKKVDITPPDIIEGSIEKEAKEIFNESVYVKVFFRLIVGDLIDSNMMQLMPLSFAKNVVDELLNAESAQAADPEATKEPVGQESNTAPEPPASQQETVKPALEQRPDEEQGSQYLGNNFDVANSTIEQASFSKFESSSPALSSNEQRNLDMLLDISLDVTVELGKTKKSIKDILDLSSGSIIELDKLAGEPVDILVNGKLIAEGEVIVIEENFGVRVTDIISQSARLMKIK